jgi:hypothetical protein
VIEAVEVARKYGTIVSYDLNYRASLWKSQGGKPGAQKVNREIAQYVDVMIGNEEDFTACLGFEVEGLDEHISDIDPANFKKMIQACTKPLPNFKVAARRCATPRPPASTTGRRSSGRAASSISRRCARTWRSTTASAAAMDSRPASLRLHEARVRRPPWNTAPRMVRCHDHAGRYLDGQREGSRSGHDGQRRARHPLRRISFRSRKREANARLPPNRRAVWSRRG